MSEVPLYSGERVKVSKMSLRKKCVLCGERTEATDNPEVKNLKSYTLSPTPFKKLKSCTLFPTPFNAIPYSLHPLNP